MGMQYSCVAFFRKGIFMNILVERTGGYAGLMEKIGPINTGQLDPKVAHLIEQMVQNIGFFDLPEMVSGGTIGADLFHYMVTITDDNRRHTVAFDYDDSPETAPLRRLVDKLMSLG